MTDVASPTLQIARALSQRLAGDPSADGVCVPELRTVVGYIAIRAGWRAGGGNRSFEAIEDRARAWPDSGCRYVDALRLARDYVQLIASTGEPGEYGTRVAAEFDDALALAPTVMLLPSFEGLAMADLLRLRATSIRIVGLRDQAAFADGGMCAPAEFFWHDLDHMRFMVREDLAVLGVVIPDAYGPPDAEGRRSTVDEATGGHRRILDAAAVPMVAQREAHGRLMARAAHTIDALLTTIDVHAADDAIAAAARLTLFEIGHEKSLTPVPEVLHRELSHDAHLAKMRLKLARRFWGDAADPALAGHLEPARALLMRLVDDVGGTA